MRLKLRNNMEFIIRATDRELIKSKFNVLYESTMTDILIIETDLSIDQLQTIEEITHVSVCRNDGRLCI